MPFSKHRQWLAESYINTEYVVGIIIRFILGENLRAVDGKERHVLQEGLELVVEANEILQR